MHTDAEVLTAGSSLLLANPKEFHTRWMPVLLTDTTLDAKLMLLDQGHLQSEHSADYKHAAIRGDMPRIAKHH